MKIKEVADKLDTTPRTIRFYEEKGLIEPQKTDNDYRHYDEHDLWKLQSILALRQVGMSTAQIKCSFSGENSVDRYLHLQRTALYEQWLEIKDMIATMDDLLRDGDYSMEDLHQLSGHLKMLKKKRKSWRDQWNFDEQARGYDGSLKMNGYRFNVHQFYQQALEKVVEWIQPQEDEKGVDIGIGTGNLGSRFLPYRVSMIGIDQSEEMLQVCHKKFPEIETRHGHFLALPVLDQTADFIVTSYALHHVEEEEKQLAIEEMNRVLKPGGRLAIADLMFEHEHDRETVLAMYEQVGNHEAVYAIGDEYYADQSLLLQWLDNNGYRTETHKFSDILHLVYAEKPIR